MDQVSVQVQGVCRISGRRPGKSHPVFQFKAEDGPASCQDLQDFAYIEGKQKTQRLQKAQKESYL